MTNWKTFLEKDHLGAWDLVGDDGKPRDFCLEIASVKGVVLKTQQVPKGKMKPVIRFKGARKAFVCNSTNGKTIETMYGPHIEDWIGKQLVLYQADVKNPDGAGTIKGIRVRSRKPTGPAEQITERPVDEAMRAEQNAAFGRETREIGEEG